MDLKSHIAEVINRRDLTFEQATDAMNIIMSGEATQAQIGSYLTALRMKGETASEIAGSAKAMRDHVIGVNVTLATDEILADIVGTGGDGAHTFNISTTSAFVIAGAGIKVAKHGNRSVSSKSGAADVLKELGGNLDLDPLQLKACIEDVGIGFLYALNHHPAMRHAIGARRELAQRTIFNALGPLTNPAGATHLMVGVYAPALTDIAAETLAKLGAKAAFVVHGADGLDELSISGINRVSHMVDGRVRTFELDPSDFGLSIAPITELVGGDPAENAAITRAILSGEDQSARRDVVLLNSAALFCVETGDFEAGLQQARASIDSGAALKTLSAWVAKTQSFTT